MWKFPLLQYALRITLDQTVLDVDGVVGPVILSLRIVTNVMVRSTESIANTAVQKNVWIRHVTNGQGHVIIAKKDLKENVVNMK